MKLGLCLQQQPSHRCPTVRTKRKRITIIVRVSEVNFYDEVNSAFDGRIVGDVEYGRLDLSPNGPGDTTLGKLQIESLRYAI